jgi:hypothetical protein
MEPVSSATTDIQQLWSTLTSEDQKELLQKFIETSKIHKSPIPTPVSPVRARSKEGIKRELQSPETPFKGKGRKVVHVNCDKLKVDTTD